MPGPPRRLSPELTKQLGDEYRQVLTAQAQGLGCNVSEFEKLLAGAQELGDPYPASVVAGFGGVVEACRTARNDSQSWRLGAQLVKEGRAAEVIDKAYVPAIRKALAEARYGDAKILAQQAVGVAPAGEGTVRAALNTERNKVAATLASLRRIGDSIKANAQYYAGGSWCFPAAAPAAVQAAKDGWGRPMFYSPLDPGGNPGCNRGFSLTSYGGDGAATANDWQSPAAEIVYRFVSGSESWKKPNSYWLTQQEGEGEFQENDA